MGFEVSRRFGGALALARTRVVERDATPRRVGAYLAASRRSVTAESFLPVFPQALELERVGERYDRPSLSDRPARDVSPLLDERFRLSRRRAIS